ncbi:hypothetical protein CPC08DRAFT_721990 [Agrocybe pediades]|nr:hypothetical protein CPC08DRAFT_721990 [Agrocybe pediades]
MIMNPCNTIDMSSKDLPFLLTIPTPSASALLSSSGMLSGTCKGNCAVLRFLNSIPGPQSPRPKAVNAAQDVSALPSQSNRWTDADQLMADEDGGSKTRAHARNYPAAEAAAQQEIEEDDQAWYYRNPHRYVRWPKNARLRMQKRKRIMRGVATGEEGAPTNRTLFAAFLMRHYPSIRVDSLLGTEDVEDCHRDEWLHGGTEMVLPSPQWNGDSRSSGSQQGLATGHSSILSPSNLIADEWQEELFTPNEARIGYGPRSRRISISSSVESYTSSIDSYDSAVSAHSSTHLDHDSPPLKVEIASYHPGTFSNAGLSGIRHKPSIPHLRNGGVAGH